MAAIYLPLLLVLFFNFALLIDSFKPPLLRSATTRLKKELTRESLCASHQRLRTKVFMEIPEFGDDENSEDSEDSEPKEILTHGYEGDFKEGDVVRVKGDITIYSVKKYRDEGFNCNEYVGTVKKLHLYGRKFNTLCSAITPVQVEFLPDAEGTPEGMMERKWMGHFAGDELELVSKAPPPAPEV